MVMAMEEPKLKGKRVMQGPSEASHEVRLAALAISFNVRLRSSDMPVHMQEHCVRYTRSLLGDPHPPSSSSSSSQHNPTHVARALKKGKSNGGKHLMYPNEILSPQGLAEGGPADAEEGFFSGEELLMHSEKISGERKRRMLGVLRFLIQGLSRWRSELCRASEEGGFAKKIQSEFGIVLEEKFGCHFWRKALTLRARSETGFHK
ncbi:dynein light chain, cytoplasmic [Senna tora]|uniref:Dynein light chain, cytoplasmic n=1 Tax=Senna tora TaxID=362788 RepID=A0A835CAU8_9FABA|nr:dynein light chain, cytoplasmic [Senna tora]